MLTLSQGGDRFWCQQIYRSLIFYFIPQSKDKPCWGSTPDAPQRVHPGSLLPVFSVVSARYPSAPVYGYLPEVPVHWDRPRNRCRWNIGYTSWRVRHLIEGTPGMNHPVASDVVVIADVGKATGTMVTTAVVHGVTLRGTGGTTMNHYQIDATVVLILAAV